jgi:hypothetical protein
VAGIHVVVPHALGQEAAQVRVAQFLDRIRQEYGHEVNDLRGAWTESRLDFAFSTRGLDVRGMLEVLELEVIVSGPLPFAALFFRGRIEQTIRDELQKALG